MKNSKNNTTNNPIPSTGLKGLKEHFSSDMTSGFLIFLLALPLSLGISKASDFPAIMGLITAMIGGIVVSWISGSELTIKGPAAGLIVIVSGAVAELGKGDASLGWHLALGAIFVAGILQIVFGLVKLGTLVDFFPLSAIHGMLAAIGIIIISKQAHLIVGVTAAFSNGEIAKEPIDLLLTIPNSLMHPNVPVLIIGIVSLIIVFGWPFIKQPLLKKIPSPLMVLFVSIPLAKWLNLDSKYLIHFGDNFIETFKWNIDFTGISQSSIFWKYVIMFALVGSLESLLTVKAIDLLDPFKRKSKTNKDLVAVGIGNSVVSLFGGLPMISEVARSSANVSNGGKTRFANFWHGIFMLLFLIFDLEFSDLIPQASLAALLIGVGYKLASPKEFGRMAKIGPEQLIVFVITVIATVLTDLLIGISVGIVVKLVAQYFLGVPLRSFFKAHTQIDNNVLKINGAAVFSNWIGINKKITQFSRNQYFLIDFTHCNVVDHTVLDNLHHLVFEFENQGGKLEIIGLEEMKYTSASKHNSSTRLRAKTDRFTAFGLKK